MRLCSIASSSEGNCIYVGSGDYHFLVDIGISRTRVVEGLEQIGVAPEEIDGIFITHEHSDHTKGLSVWMKKNPVPVYATAETFYAMSHARSAIHIKEEYLCPVEKDVRLLIGNIEIMPFEISHDAANPVGYTFTDHTGKAGIATDLGVYTDYTIEHLKGANVLLLEANHDINMLEVGKYPYVLKRRILGDKGHLSNDNAGRLIRSLLSESLEQVFLGHLSKENNFKELAYETVCYEVSESDSPYKETCMIEVADRLVPSMLYDTNR